MSRPTVPPDHPMADYANYMMDHVDRVFIMLWLLILSVTLLALAFTFFGVQKWLERQDLRRWRDEVRTLLSVIKGWTVVSTSTAERSVVEVKEKIKEVPDQTATKVVEQISRMDPGSFTAPASPSGTHKKPQPPPTATEPPP